ncbi:hypothetical protein JKF63_06436 [Porcisia hertigi]|uniref:Protein kinase domain-containing protein n=1 Tax=Porcisia hertigi TaxID=2761500 RepID=A0A836LJY2_9TRYP|nr:hypothetical protein JKF63_06436 [Porcisia hertigi]
MSSPRVITWRRWATKRADQNGFDCGDTAVAHSQASSSSSSTGATSSMAVTTVVLAALTAASASVAYLSYRALARRTASHRDRSAPRCRQPVRPGEASGPAHGIETETILTSSLLPPNNTVAISSPAGRRSESLDRCGSVAAHSVAPADSLPTGTLDNAIDPRRLLEADVRVKPLISTPDTDTTAGAPSPSSPPATPNALLTSFYDLEPYALQGIAAGAHGWRRVFGLLKPEARKCARKDSSCSKGAEVSPAGAPARRVPLSLTRTCEATCTTAGVHLVFTQDPSLAILPIASATAKPSLPRIASTDAGMCSSSTVRSDISVQSRVSGQSIRTTTTTTTRAAQWCDRERQYSPSITTTSTSTSPSAEPLPPPRPSVSLATGALSPPSRLISSLSFHVLQHLSFRVSRSTSKSTRGSSTTDEATSVLAGSGAGTASSASSVATSVALATAQRNLQRDISSLVATAASARPGVSVSSSVSASHVHTALCSTVPSVAVSPRVAAMSSCGSNMSYHPLMPTESRAHLITSCASSSRGSGQYVVKSRSFAGSVGREPQQGVGRSSSSQCTGINPHGQHGESGQGDTNVVGSCVDQCEQAIPQVAEEEEMGSPPPLTVLHAAPAWSSPALPPEATPTEAPDAAGTGPTGGGSLPFSTLACRRTIAEQLAVLTSRRERQHRYTEQLQASRGSGGLRAGIASGVLQSPSGTCLLPTSTDAAVATASTGMDLSRTELTQRTSGMYGQYPGSSQYHTDTPPGLFCSSLLQSYHYENHVYSDLTTEVQQCKRRRQRDCGRDNRACATAAPMAGAEGDSAGHETHTETVEMATAAAAATTGALPRHSRERPATEANVLAALHAAAARRVSASASTPYCIAGPNSGALLSPPKQLQPSNERRVDDLTVKHQENGSASYSISLTYHDSETGTPRTVNTSALPPLRRGDAGASIPGLSSFSGGASMPPSSRAKQPSTTTAAATSAADGVSPAHSTGGSHGTVPPAGAPKSSPGCPPTVISAAKPVFHWPPYRAPDAEDSGVVSRSVGPIQAARAGGGRLRPAARSGVSVGECSKCRHSPAAVAATADDDANSTPAGDATKLSTHGKVNPFAAPLPPTEPPHGPRLRGVAGRNGEMAIGAFLGGGACGKVYECLNTETGQVLAAKQIVFDAKDRRLRARLKQLELELEVLTLAARHHVPWIVGFYGAEKRGHSVLMYLEYCQRGSLLDYMMAGNSADVAVWSPSRLPDGAALPSSTAPGGLGVGCRFDLNDSSPVAAVEAWRRGSEGADGAANCLITESTLQGLRESHRSHTHSAASPALIRQEPAPPPPQQQQQQAADDGPAASEGVPKEETVVAAVTGHAPAPGRTLKEQQEEEEEECTVCRGGTLLATAAASVSSVAESASFSRSTWDTIQLSEAPQPQMPPLSIHQVQRFTRQIVNGLCFLHQYNYAHLDVKTANVLVTADEQCRLADLGCAMRLQPPPPASPSQQQGEPPGADRTAKESANGSLDDGLSKIPPYPVLVDRDAIKELRGTALYMAPEMIRFESHAIGSPADSWSLGCVVMEMATGCAPWRHIAKDKLRVLYRIGSARDELPLPPLMQAWAEQATEWLAQECPSETVAASKPQDSVAACTVEPDDAARAPDTCSAMKTDRSRAVPKEFSEPCAQRRRVEDVTCDGGGNRSAVAADRIGKEGPPLLNTLGIDCGTSMQSISPSCTPADTSLTHFARLTSATSTSLLAGAESDDENGAADEAEEQCFRTECRTMRLYVALLDFVAACVRVRPEDRSSAAQLLHHPFLHI